MIYLFKEVEASDLEFFWLVLRRGSGWCAGQTKLERVIAIFQQIKNILGSIANIIA